MEKGPCWARAWLQNQRAEPGPKGSVQELQEVESPNTRGSLTGVEAETQTPGKGVKATWGVAREKQGRVRKS